MDKAPASSASSLQHLEVNTSHLRRDTFRRFPDFPTEVRLLIWKAAIPIDSSTAPITVKPYSHTYRDRRVPPKTSRINRESREVTLKHFRRMELQRAEVQSSKDHKWLRRNFPTHLIFWDKDNDVLTLDWWCLVSNVNNVISYLSLKPFIEEETGTVSCVQILAIDTGIRNIHLGSHLKDAVEKKFGYFVRLREVRLLNWSPNRTFEEERQLVGMLEACFILLSIQNKGYCVPRISVMLPVDTNSRLFQ
jgi:hypothetical protein